MTTFFNTAICLSDFAGAGARLYQLKHDEDTDISTHHHLTRMIQIRTIINRALYYGLTTVVSASPLLGATQIALQTPAAFVISAIVTAVVMEILTVLAFGTIAEYVKYYIDDDINLTFSFSDGLDIRNSHAKESIRVIVDVAENVFCYYQAYRSTGLEFAIRGISAVIVTLCSPTLQNIVLSVTSSD